MTDITLFTDADGAEYTYHDIIVRLHDIGAHDCDMLFIHTDVMFGVPNIMLSRKEYLQTLYHALLELHVKTLVFPAFTFSFCNNEVYDVVNSKTNMGALVEHIRKQPNVVRSLDPLLSLFFTPPPRGWIAKNLVTTH